MLRYLVVVGALLASNLPACGQSQESTPSSTKTDSATQAAVIIPAYDRTLPPWADDIAATDTVGAGRFGPSAASTVYLGSGVYQNNPDSDITMNNPTGPMEIFERLYRTSLAANGYATPGLSVGWVHVYDMRIVATSGSSWSKLTVIWFNGAKEELDPLLDDGVPTGKFQPAGRPYVVTGQAGAATGRWNWLMIKFGDESSLIFGPDAKNPNLYRLRRLAQNVGKPIDVHYDASGRLQQITRSDDKKCFEFAYDANGYLSTATAHDDAGKPVTTIRYTFGQAAGTTCLLSVSQINRSDVQCAYGYTAVAGRPFLSAVGVPDPTGQPGLSVARINYDANGRVSCMVDANKNQRCYTYGDARTLVEVKEPSGKVVQSWIQKLGKQ